jgi:hypothetical protein
MLSKSIESHVDNMSALMTMFTGLKFTAYLNIFPDPAYVENLLQSYSSKNQDAPWLEEVEIFHKRFDSYFSSILIHYALDLKNTHNFGMVPVLRNLGDAMHQQRNSGTNYFGVKGGWGGGSGVGFQFYCNDQMLITGGAGGGGGISYFSNNCQNKSCSISTTSFGGGGGGGIQFRRILLSEDLRKIKTGSTFLSVGGGGGCGSGDSNVAVSTSADAKIDLYCGASVDRDSLSDAALKIELQRSYTHDMFKSQCSTITVEGGGGGGGGGSGSGSEHETGYGFGYGFRYKLVAHMDDNGDNAVDGAGKATQPWEDGGGSSTSPGMLNEGKEGKDGDQSSFYRSFSSLLSAGARSRSCDARFGLGCMCNVSRTILFDCGDRIAMTGTDPPHSVGNMTDIDLTTCANLLKSLPQLANQLDLICPMGGMADGNNEARTGSSPHKDGIKVGELLMRSKQDPSSANDFRISFMVATNVSQVGPTVEGDSLQVEYAMHLIDIAKSIANDDAAGAGGVASQGGVSNGGTGEVYGPLYRRTTTLSAPTPLDGFLQSSFFFSTCILFFVVLVSYKWSKPTHV